MSEKLNQATDKDIATFLKTNRKAKNMTQQQVAERAGMQGRQYQRFENGERSLVAARFFTTMSVLEALGVDANYFIKTYLENY